MSAYCVFGVTKDLIDKELLEKRNLNFSFDELFEKIKPKHSSWPKLFAALHLVMGEVGRGLLSVIPLPLMGGGSYTITYVLLHKIYTN